MSNNNSQRGKYALKVTFEYQSVVSGKCIIEVDREGLLMSCRVNDEITTEDTDNLRKHPPQRILFHHENLNLEVSHPVIDSCSKAFYRNISAADIEVRKEIDKNESEIDITSLSDKEKVTL